MQETHRHLSHLCAVMLVDLVHSIKRRLFEISLPRLLPRFGDYPERTQNLNRCQLDSVDSHGVEHVLGGLLVISFDQAEVVHRVFGYKHAWLRLLLGRPTRLQRLDKFVLD